VRSIALTLALAALAACAVPSPTPADAAAPNADADAARAQTPAAATTPPTTVAQAPDPAPPAPARKRMKTGGPLPPERIDDPKLPPEIKVDTSCRTDADCTVKNVGNCCGQYPACVNVDSPTDPKGVQARCAQSGMAAVCGFPEISGCSCVKGSCQAAANQAVEETTR
jgi:hypothetical protein